MPYATRLYSIVLLATFLLAACAAPGSVEPAVLSPEAPTATVAEATPATPTVVALAGEQRSEQGGFSLRFPEGWVAREVSGTLTLAASEAQLSGNTPGDNLVLQVESAALSALAAQRGGSVISDTTEFFSLSAEGISGPGVIVSAPEAVRIAGREALAADLQSEGALGRMITILAPPQGLRLIAQSSPTSWPAQRALFERIVGSLELFEPPPPPTATPSPDQAIQPALLTASDDSIEGFELRMGGNEGTRNSRFASARGLAVAPDGTLYLAESSQGVWVFNPDGTLLRTFGKGELLDAYDVALGPGGEIFVADFGRNAISRFTPEGNLALRWGEAGDAPGQFGLLAPQRIAVSADGTVYALSSRVQADSQAASSVLRFKGDDGSFIDAIDLPAGSAPNDLAVDQAGNIYLAETFGGGVVKLDSSGTVAARFGEQTGDQGLTAGALDVDSEGNIYVATWSNGILKLSPTGTTIAQVGATAASGSIPKPGEFSLPNGLVAAGNVVWVSDNSGEYSAVSAMRLEEDPALAATASTDATAVALANATPTPDLPPVSVWAASATATSQYDESYAAANVVGPPDAPGCSSGQGSWASSDPNGQDTLEVTFAEPLVANGLRVYQNHQPGFIVSVEVIDAQGKARQVYAGKPQLSSTCPDLLRISFAAANEPIVSARIVLDQRSGASWNEIDAVELVGFKP